MALENVLVLGFDGYHTNSFVGQAAGTIFFTNPRFTQTVFVPGGSNWRTGQAPSFPAYGGKSIVNNFFPANDFIQCRLEDGGSTLFVSAAARFFLSGAVTTPFRIIQFVDSTDSDAVQIYVELNAAGALICRRADGTLLANSSSGVISNDRWGLLLMKITFHGSDGTVSVIWEGVEVLAGSGLNTQPGANARADKVYLGNFAGWDHVVVDKGEASDSNRGPALVKLLSPNADGATTDFLRDPDAGSNFANVDDVPYSPADKVTGLLGDRDEYELSDLGDGSDPLILGGRLEIFAARSSIAPRAVKIGVKLDTDEDQSDVIALAAEDSIWDYQLGATAPDASAWSEATIDALEATIEVTS